MTDSNSMNLPVEGDVFSLQIPNGRYVACRVILDSSSSANERRQRIYKAPNGVLMACCNWFGNKPPEGNEPELHEILLLTHHSWKKNPLMGWWSHPVPENMVPIGKIPPTDAEKKKGDRNGDLMDLANLFRQTQMQWEWDHDREALLEREKSEEEQLAREFEEMESKRLKELTLDKLTKHRFLPGWDSPIPITVIRKSRKLLRETATELVELGKKPSVKSRLDVLKGCIEQFNTLDAKHSFIETIEREDICEAFDMLVHACGLSSRENLADKWREW